MVVSKACLNASGTYARTSDVLRRACLKLAKRKNSVFCTERALYLRDKCTNPHFSSSQYLSSIAIGAAIFQAIERQSEIRRGDIAADRDASSNPSSDQRHRGTIQRELRSPAEHISARAAECNWVYGASRFYDT